MCDNMHVILFEVYSKHLTRVSPLGEEAFGHRAGQAWNEGKLTQRLSAVIFQL